MKETLTKVLHDYDFALAGLQEALHGASNVEALILLDRIKDTAELKSKVAALLRAHNADREVTK